MTVTVLMPRLDIRGNVDGLRNVRQGRVHGASGQKVGVAIGVGNRPNCGSAVTPSHDHHVKTAGQSGQIGKTDRHRILVADAATGYYLIRGNTGRPLKPESAMLRAAPLC